MEVALNEYRSLGYSAHGLIFDVTDEEAAQSNIDNVENTIGTIDILVNIASLQE
jgi:NADP-dependent 3-hydroxy acid dehydrogenase YdfG